mmetsp:Transcript_39155/g.88957  ORF Transcript_39155/g.88957 Transcript_39155/m.88957 type:complete len:364 (-) Transcript_39155:642-1733(-)
MDLLSRIEAQNAEMDRIASEKSSLARHRNSLSEQDGSVGRQLSAAVGHVTSAPALTEDALRAQERELDQQLQLEQARFQARQPTGHKLTLPAHGKENGGRASIPLLPQTGAPRAPPTASVANSVTPSERRRRPVHFTHAMVKETCTSQMDEFMNPVNGIRDQMRRAGIAPKNHLREQRERISELATMRQQKTQAEAAAEDERLRKEQQLRSRSRQHHQATRQTLEFGEEAPGLAPRGPSAGRRSSRQPEAPPPRAHEAGAVPAYLQRRKAQWAAEEAADAERAAAEAQCPPGLRLVGPEEKERILQTLADEKAKATLELQSLPFVIKTKASQQRKDKLEDRLEQIDKATAEYLKEKVFVPATS